MVSNLESATFNLELNVGCVTGGLAGVHYGFTGIPKEWIDAIARKEDIGKLLTHFTSKIEGA